MGFFDRLVGKKSTPPPGSGPAPAPASEAPSAAAAAATDAAAPAYAGNVMARLVEARQKLEAKDRDGAVAIYEEVLAAAGDRADVLVTISGDLGVNGRLREIVELVAPRYDADRHGPATGLNVLQAYLALREADAAQHILDILFALNRPELEERLHGFSNALADLINSGQRPLVDTGAEPTADAGEARPEPPRVNIVTISKPMWSYGLEPVPDLLPLKEGRLRRVAFAQLALPGQPEIEALATRPEEELGRLSRALPLWLAETFYFSPHYAAVAALGVRGQPGAPGHYALFPAEWTPENLRQIVESSDEGLDYIFTGALRQQDGDYELVLRVWEVRKFRERKQFAARWTPATADAELARLHDQVRQFMEWSPDPRAAAYVAPAAPTVWLDTLGASATLFLAEKGLLAREQLPGLAGVFTSAAAHAADDESASLAYLALCARARRLDLPLAPAEVPLKETPRVAAARAAG